MRFLDANLCLLSLDNAISGVRFQFWDIYNKTDDDASRRPWPSACRLSMPARTVCDALILAPILALIINAGWLIST